MAVKGNGKMTGKPVTYRTPSPANGVQMETFIPWKLVKRRVRREIITPLDAPGEFKDEAAVERRERLAAQDTALTRALGLAYHWQRLLDEGKVESIMEIAVAEDIGVTQVRRLIRLTLLAPEVVEELAGTPDVVLEKLMRRSWAANWVNHMVLVALPRQFQGGRKK